MFLRFAMLAVLYPANCRRALCFSSGYFKGFFCIIRAATLRVIGFCSLTSFTTDNPKTFNVIHGLRSYVWAPYH